MSAAPSKMNLWRTWRHLDCHPVTLSPGHPVTLVRPGWSPRGMRRIRGVARLRLNGHCDIVASCWGFQQDKGCKVLRGKICRGLIVGNITWASYLADFFHTKHHFGFLPALSCVPWGLSQRLIAWAKQPCGVGGVSLTETWRRKFQVASFGCQLPFYMFFKACPFTIQHEEQSLLRQGILLDWWDFRPHPLAQSARPMNHPSKNWARKASKDHYRIKSRKMSSKILPILALLITNHPTVIILNLCSCIKSTHILTKIPFSTGLHLFL